MMGQCGGVDLENWAHNEVVELNKVNAAIRKGRKLIKVHVNGLKPFY